MIVDAMNHLTPDVRPAELVRIEEQLDIPAVPLACCDWTSLTLVEMLLSLVNSIRFCLSLEQFLSIFP